MGCFHGKGFAGAPPVGPPLGGFRLMGGKEVTLQDYSGKPVVLHLYTG